MTTFTTEDLESLLTDWFPADVEPTYDGEYEVMSSAWPWPHRETWSKKKGWETVINIEKWRGLKEKIE